MTNNTATKIFTDRVAESASAESLWPQLKAVLNTALETYANVHRGSGHASLVTTHLYEAARKKVLDHLHLSARKYIVIFASEARANRIVENLPAGHFHMVHSADIGVPAGVCALAVEKTALPGGDPEESGGGTTRLIGEDWVIWSGAPDRFEAGTPAIVNVVAFASALAFTQQSPPGGFPPDAASSVDEILYTDPFEYQHGENLLNGLLETRIGRHITVPTTHGENAYVHLDHSASTPTFSPILDVFIRTLQQPVDVQKELVEETAKTVCRVFDAPANTHTVSFTANTTEAVYLASRQLSASIPDNIRPIVLCSMLEHSSNDLPWRQIPGCQVIHIPVDNEGFLDMDILKALLHKYNRSGRIDKQRVVLVSISAASNVLGTCNDIAEISEITHAHGARLFVDAAQLAAHRAISVKQWSADFMAFSGHKVYAPFGCGALISKQSAPAAYRFSCDDQYGVNAAGIAAMGKALGLLERIGFELIASREHQLLQYGLQQLKNIPGLRLYGISDADSPRLRQKVAVIPFDIKNEMPATTARNLALHGGIGVRYGCHCAHIIVKQMLHIGPKLQMFQRVLQRLIPPLKFQGVVRLSFGLENTMADVDAVVATLMAVSTERSAPTPLPHSMKDTKKRLKAFTAKRESLVYPMPQQ